MLQVKGFTFNAFQENTWVISSAGEALIVDPGCYSTEEKKELDDYIRTSGLKVVMLINTHGHIDHVLGNDHVTSTYGIPLLIHTFDVPVLQAVKAYASNYGFPAYREVNPGGHLEEGQFIRFGTAECRVLFLPGHAPGHIGLYFSKEGKLFSGDVLFHQSIGRTDLPGGDFETLIRSIQAKVFALPGDTTIYPGHGDTTTVAFEMMHNPFCAIQAS